MEWLVALIMFMGGYGLGAQSVEPEIHIKEIIQTPITQVSIKSEEGYRVANLVSPKDIAEGCEQPLLVSDLTTHNKEKRTVQVVKIGCVE